MANNRKQLSNPASTGGLGAHFESRVQAAFSVLMLAGGFSPCLPRWPIEKLQPQAKCLGFETDDLIVYSKNPVTGKEAKLLGQIKLSVAITKNDCRFAEVIQAAWTDFNNAKVFLPDTKDVIALICGSLPAVDTKHTRRLLEQARSAEDGDDFYKRIRLGKFTSDAQRKKLEVFETQLKKANDGVPLKKDSVWKFLKSFHLLIYDLDIQSGVTLSLLHTLIDNHSAGDSESLFAQIQLHIEQKNENSGLISIAGFTEEIRCKFKSGSTEKISDEFIATLPRILLEIGIATNTHLTW